VHTQRHLWTNAGPRFLLCWLARYVDRYNYKIAVYAELRQEPTTALKYASMVRTWAQETEEGARANAGTMTLPMGR
jgi:hypothetical protein